MLAVSASCHRGCQCPKRQRGWTLEARALESETLLKYQSACYAKIITIRPRPNNTKGNGFVANLDTRGYHEVNHVDFNSRPWTSQEMITVVSHFHPMSSIALWAQVASLTLRKTIYEYMLCFSYWHPRVNSSKPRFACFVNCMLSLIINT